MKTHVLFSAFLAITFLQSSYAQTSELKINNGLGIGMNLNQFQKDFGMGINITSPFFANDRIAFRLRGNLMFHEHLQELTTTWSQYSNLSLGIIGVGGYVGDYIRLYGEGGIVGLIPSNEFSTEDFELGGYGLFGFEFFMEKSINYFIEIGGVGTGARADKVAFEPIYSNGLLIGVGVRFYLK